MTWGKVDPDKLPDSVTCYVDSTIALPLLTGYSLSRRQARTPRRLMDRMPQLIQQLEASYANRRKKEEVPAAGSP
jgi:deoxyhypusine synthase